MPPELAQLPMAITHLGLGICSYTRRIEAPIFLNGVPEMIMTSDSRGVPRSTSAPKRARSKRGVILVIISTKQQDRPKNIGHRLFLRPQLIRSSARVSNTPCGSFSLMRNSGADYVQAAHPNPVHPFSTDTPTLRTD